MKAYISQPAGTMKCGAYSIAYYLWETKKDKNINDRDFVESIYKRIIFGTNNLGFREDYSDPDKMINELNNNWGVKSSYCISKESIFTPFFISQGISIADENIFDKLKEGQSKYAIIICSLEECSTALHYMLIRYENNSFQMLDSLAIYDDDINNVTWEKFVVKSDNKLMLEAISPYLYMGMAIVME